MDGIWSLKVIGFLNPDKEICSKILGEEIKEGERSSGDLFDSPRISQNKKLLNGVC